MNLVYQTPTLLPKVESALSCDRQVANEYSINFQPQIAAIAASSLAHLSEAASADFSSSSSSSTSESDETSSSESDEAPLYQIDLANENCHQETIDLSLLIEHYESKNSAAIIRDQRLFWTLFCKLHCNPRNSVFGKLKFTTKQQNTALSILGIKKHVDYLAWQIEQLRQIFFCNLEAKKPFTVIVLEYNNQIYLRAKSSVVPILHHRYESSSRYVDLFYENIRHTIGDICIVLEMPYVIKKISQAFFPVLYSTEPCEQYCEAFKINFN